MVSRFTGCRIKPSMMSLSADDDGQLRSIRLFGGSEALEGFDHLRVFLINDSVELPLRDTIAVHDNSAWQRFLVFLIELKPFFHHDLQLGNHLVGSQPGSASNNPRRKCTSFFVSWILRLAGNCAKLSSMVATTAATDGVPLTEPGLGWVTSIPTNIVG